MSIASVEISIPAPVNVVFAVASDWSRWESWFVGTSGFKPLTTLTRGSGARFAYRASILGIPVPVVTEICDFVENVGWRGVSRRGPRSETRWQFEAIPAGTRFSFAMEYSLPLIPKALDAALVRPAWARLLKRSAERLRQIIEAEAHAAPAASSTQPGEHCSCARRYPEKS